MARKVTTAPSLRALNPDFPFDYASWLSNGKEQGLGTIPDTPRKPDTHHEGTPENCDVAIVGAGTAGIVAAYELARMGLRPQVFEPGEVGGRLRSVRMGADEGSHLVAELGGMRFPSSGQAFYHYVDELELATEPFPNPGTPAARRTVIDLESSHEPEVMRQDSDRADNYQQISEAWDHALEHVGKDHIQELMKAGNTAELQKVWSDLVERWDDKSFWNFLVQCCDLTPDQRETFGQVGFGTGGWDSDFPNTMLEIFRVVFSAFEDDQCYIVGGAQQVPQGLWRKPIPIHNGESMADMHGGAPRPGVRKICPTGDQDHPFRVVDEWGTARDFRCVLLTPQTWLYRAALDVDDQLFSAEMWPAFERTNYMSSSKAIVMLDRAFWNDPEYLEENEKLPFSMTVTDRSTRATYLIEGSDPDGPAIVILSYAWESDAQKVLPLNSSDRVERALDTLEKIYGEETIQRLRESIIGEPVTVSWSADPYFLGAFKGALPGHYEYNRRMFSHFFQRDSKKEDGGMTGIFVAGDGISFTPAWAEGAVQTALNAVWGIMKHLEGSSHNNNPGPGDQWEQLKPRERTYAPRPTTPDCCQQDAAPSTVPR